MLRRGWDSTSWELQGPDSGRVLLGGGRTHSCWVGRLGHARGSVNVDRLLLVYWDSFAVAGQDGTAEADGLGRGYFGVTECAWADRFLFITAEV